MGRVLVSLVFEGVLIIVVYFWGVLGLLGCVEGVKICRLDLDADNEMNLEMNMVAEELFLRGSCSWEYLIHKRSCS